MFAVISDIHGNLGALDAVLDDIRCQSIDRILCLGDIIGYGPDPGACLTQVRESCEVILRGNHDLAVLEEPLGFNRAASDAVRWTRARIRPRLWSGPEKRANWRLLQNAGSRFEEDDLLFVHASPRDPVTEYIDEADTVDMGFGVGEKIRAILALVSGICFHGHTHRPGVVGPDFHFHPAGECAEGWLRSDRPALVNVGSVGQPRDQDPRACYVTVDAERIRFRRIVYDIEAVVRKFEQIPELDARLGERLRTGT